MSSSQPTGAFPLEHSSYLRQWEQEKAHIQRNQWFLSERAGHDVGWEYAQWDWIWRHRARWVAAGRPPLS